jgi:hypothetical protein
MMLISAFIFTAPFIFTGQFSIAANQTHDGNCGKPHTENSSVKLECAKKRELENTRKDMVDDAKQGYVSGSELKKGSPQFLRAVHCPELVEKVK